jgi:hypothetical protein
MGRLILGTDFPFKAGSRLKIIDESKGGHSLIMEVQTGESHLPGTL